MFRKAAVRATTFGFTRFITTKATAKMPLINAGTGKPRVILGTMTFG